MYKDNQEDIDAEQVEKLLHGLWTGANQTWTIKS